MYRTLSRTNQLLAELNVLGLLAPDQMERFSASADETGDPSDCARLLVAAGVLTSYQAEQVLAGKGRQLFLGPYVLLEHLGGGGMGHVFKAEHQLMKRMVAVKIVGAVSLDPKRSRWASGDEVAWRSDPSPSDVLLRFKKEVQAVSRLHHPNIVTAYDAGLTRGLLYLAMEYVEGIDLERLVVETGPLPVALACEIVRQTAAALQYAHERGLVHRDIKPANLMLAQPGISVKLLDLGLAQVADSPSSADEELCGTPDYMAPEWGHDPTLSDVRGDLYSLGCTFYFLLTGQVPYPGGSWTEKLLRHSLDLPAPVCALRPGIPANVAAVVERLMAREREDRYSTAAAVAQVMESVADSPPSANGETEGAAPAVAPTKALRRTARRRLSHPALAAVLVGALVALGARWLVSSTVEPPAPSNETRPGRFAIEGRADDFVSLEQVVAAARDGDVVLIPGPGPFTTPPLCWRGKALTFRAAAGARPRLEMIASGDDPWEALFRTDRALTLEGLDLVVSGGPRGRSASSAAAVISCEGVSLRLTDCQLTGSAKGAAVVARNPSEVIVQGCRIDAGTVGLSVEVGQREVCRVRVMDTRLTMRAAKGAGLSLWAPEVRQSTRVALELRGNTIRAGRVAALRALPAGLTISAHGNRFRFADALLSCTGYPNRADCRRSTVWEGGDNSYDGPASRLWIDGQPVPVSEIKPPR